MARTPTATDHRYHPDPCPHPVLLLAHPCESCCKSTLSCDALCRPPALAQNLVTEEWDGIRKQTPIVMGEFGCNANWYPNASMCSPHVRQLQVTPTPPRAREVSAAALSSFALSLFAAFCACSPSRQVRSRPPRCRQSSALVVPADLELRRWLHKLALLDVRLQRRSAGLVRDGG